VNNKSDDGNGTFEDPFGSLLGAQNGSSPGDVIYVFPGDGTTRGMDQGINLQDNQQFLGSGLPYTFNSKFGLETIPAQSKTYPIITNLNGNIGFGDVVNLGNNNIVSGMNMQMISSPSNPFPFGVYAQLVSNGKIVSNIFYGAYIAVEFDNCSGTWTVENNTMTNLEVGGITVSNNQPPSDSPTFYLNNNTISGNGSTASHAIELSLQNSNPETITAFIQNNTISNIVAGNGAITLFTVGAIGSTTLDFKIDGNTISNNGGEGIEFIPQNANGSVATGQITNNIINQSNAFAAIFVQTAVHPNQNLCLRLSGNIVNGTSNYTLAKSATGTYNIESPNGAQSGVEALNTPSAPGSYMFSGPIAFPPPGTCFTP
jgi:hypothetical protein